jgi:hypothetical protein
MRHSERLSDTAFVSAQIGKDLSRRHSDMGRMCTPVCAARGKDLEGIETGMSVFFVA